MTCVENPWNSVDGSQVEHVVAVLGTTGGENEGPIRKLRGYFREILTALVTAVASGHDDEPLDLSLLDLFDDRSREGENRIVGETDRNLLPFFGLQTFQLFGLGDDR